ncbi:LysR substrate-binding domain-containing protein [Frankia gtarii]|uniref:LysR substrate-binding domain-containing protein n=1 Tax=Frankia gtarii TaxID=2950102 RepID=UPI0021C08928|nr:LysR substrate-binding domain-containing protein [Frankia gtarii]
MSVDLNLLVVLDAVLAEGSVSAAARELHLSIPATSRALGRLRRALDDPLLVRSGRGLTPTARALALRPRVHALVQEARLLTAGTAAADEVSTLRRSFAVLADDVALALLSGRFLAGIRADAPGVTVRFLAPDPARGHGVALREGLADLELRVNARRDPDLRGQGLLRDQLVGIVHPRHPLAASPVTAEDLAGADHLEISDQGELTGPLDALLQARGLHRKVVASVPTVLAALLTLLDSDLVAVAPALLAARHAQALGLHAFAIPVPLKGIRVSQLWHPRHDADPTHAWLRTRISETIRVFETARVDG